jgi:hypothetical protein
MKCSCFCFDSWFIHGHLWLLLGSVGYALYDLGFGFIPWFCEPDGTCGRFGAALAPSANALTVVLALCYLVSSVAYLVGLRRHYPEMAGWRNAWIWTEWGNVASSALYVVSQGLYFAPEYNDPTALSPFRTAVLAQAWTYFLAQLFWSANAVHYVYAYFAMRRHYSVSDPILRDADFWAEVFNTLACLGYCATTLWALVLMSMELRAGTLEEVQILVYDNQTLQLLINLAWDVGFSLSAICYLIAWSRDRRAALDEQMQEEKPLVVPPDSGTQSDSQDL